jgi:hypothetical protein
MMFSLGTEEYFPLVHSYTWPHIIVKSCSFAFKVGRLGSGLLFVDDLGRDTKLGMAEFRSFFIESDSQKITCVSEDPERADLFRLELAVIAAGCGLDGSTSTVASFACADQHRGDSLSSNDEPCCIISVCLVYT